MKWAQTWQMNLNTSKCVVLTCSRLISTSLFNYSIGDHLSSTTCHSASLSRNIIWFKNVFLASNITSKATRTLNFLKCNLCKRSLETKCVAYTSIVRPLLEYGSAVWEEYLQKDIYSIEMVQSRAARWVTSDYNYNSSVSTMLTNLQWPSLQHCRYITRLKIFYNMINSTSMLKIPPYFSNTSYPTRRHHPLRFLSLEQIITNLVTTPDLSVIGITYLSIL